MADISASLKDWSTTAGSNAPAGSTAIGTGLDDNLRQIQATMRAAIAAQDSIASAGTCDIGSKDAGTLTVTGTTTITSFGTVSAGIRKRLIFGGALTLTHNATSLILPTAANITTAVGDVAEVESLGSGNWRCTNYAKADGRQVAGVTTFGDGSAAAPSIAFTNDLDCGLYRIAANNIGLTLNGAKVADFGTTTCALTLAAGSYASAPTYSFGGALTLATAPGNAGGNNSGAVTLKSGDNGNTQSGDVTIQSGDTTNSSQPGSVTVKSGSASAFATSGAATLQGGGATTTGGAAQIMGGAASGSSGTTGGKVGLFAGKAGAGRLHASVRYDGNVEVGHDTTVMCRWAGDTGLWEWNTAVGGPAITSGAGTGATITGTHNACTITFGTTAGTALVIDLSTVTNAKPAANAPIPTLTFQSATAAITYRISALSSTSMTVTFASAPASGDKLHIGLHWYY